MKFIVLFFLLTSSSSSSSSSSYSYAQSPAAPAVAHVPSTRATLPMLLVIFLFALLFTAFCSIFICYCSHEEQPQVLPEATRAIPRGVDPRVLATCPITSYSTVKMRMSQNPVFQCAVSLAEFDDANALRLLPKCSHVFHTHCIDASLSSVLSKKIKHRKKNCGMNRWQ
ncbi:E3 ubiquitin-protein ligase ATL6-like [Glycine soja]|uniref:RING-type E3 ubiquitin transferase n=1 Tax=Glycine soja TaxID=3848 RepID=A0A445GX56_GLYSO|nr:E3 ubiquitin-protein ligase ATL6-like [Glycine soja]RZB65849.1 E3 ubiquitin-protein ligase ATL6 [Glycine soja]